MRLLRSLMVGLLLLGLLVMAAPTSYAATNRAPALSVIIPSSSNVRFIDVLGQTEPGVQVYVNSTLVKTNDKGTFATSVNLDLPGIITVTAIDAAGNQSIATRRVTFDPSVEWIRVFPRAGMAGYAPPNTKYGPFGAVPGYEVDPLNLFRWIANLHLGQNVILLEFQPPTGESYYRQYHIFRPLEIDLPTKTNVADLSVPARLADGWRLSIDGTPVTTDKDGRFTFTRKLHGVQNKIPMTFTEPSGAVVNYTVQINYVDPRKSGKIKQNEWQIEWYSWPTGTVMTADGAKTFVMPASVYAPWSVPLKCGLNDLKINYLKTDGDAATIWYQETNPCDSGMPTGR